ncbi:MAG: hypothetical protein M3680_08340 [Myxococcota bacterium]|nr:hypothetical protein [Myxococcota bacterium]
MRVGLLSLLMASLCAAACVEPSLVPCGELTCPASNVCTAGGCATPANVAACAGFDEGASCRASSGVTGTCQGGACKIGLCGNAMRDLGELCDDGNQISGDGCRADCAKLESCGDGALDEGEACDDGNGNPADGCDACAVVVWRARTVVGGQLLATSTALANPNGAAVDGLGRLYIADTDNHRVHRVDLDGSVTTIAGTGTAGYSGDAGAATSAQLRGPAGVAVDGIGRVFIADTANQRIRRVELDGTIRTIAGTGSTGYAGDGGPAVLAQLSGPHGIGVDGLGRVFVADSANHRIRRIEADGSIATVAGTGLAAFGGDGGPATSAQLATPYGVAIDVLGRVLIADTSNQRIRVIDVDDTIATVAGTGQVGIGGDGGAATAAELSFPVSVAVDATGQLFIADTLNQRLRRVGADGIIATIAGTGVAGFAGDGGAATSAQLANPLGVAVDGLGRIAIADTSNQRIRRIAADGTISTIAGNGTFGFGGDGASATTAQLSSPYGVTFDAQGRIYVADGGNQRICRIDLDGTLRTIAGTGSQGSSGDGGPAIRAQLTNPIALVVDATGRVVIADTLNHRLRRIELDGTITTIAGTGVTGYAGDGGPATSARLDNPNGVAVDQQDRVVFADTFNQRIRRIALDGTITTIAGNGSFGAGGDGGLATSASLGYPRAITIDNQGRLLIGDTGNHRIRRVEADGTIHTIVGTGVQGFSGDGGAAVTAQLNSPHGLEVDAQGRVVLTDGLNHRIRRVALDGTISTIAGSGPSGPSGDGGLATMANLSRPNGFAIDAAGRIVIVDTNNHRLRRFEVGGVLTTIAGKIDPDGTGGVAAARLANPQALVVTPAITLTAGGTSGTVEAVREGRVEVIAGRYPQTIPTGALARFRTASFGTVGGVAIDPASGRIYVAETSAHRVLVITQVDPAAPGTWTIATLANAAGIEGFADGAAGTARLRAPGGLFLDRATGTLYIADTGNHAIRALDVATNTITTVVNTNHRLGFAGDGGPAGAALLFRPTAVTRCPGGDLFVADTSNNRIRRVDGAGTITTVLGDGVPASSGEGEPAQTFPVDGPRGLACDARGNLFVTSTTTVRLLPASDTGVVDGEGAVQTIYGGLPRVTFPSAVTGCLTGLAVTSATTVQVSDACTGLVVELERVPAP